MNAGAMLPLHEEAVRADARLAGVEELHRRGALRRVHGIGVVEHDERRVAAELQADPLDMPGGAGGDELADLGRAGEGDLAHGRVIDELTAHGAALGGGDQVDDALRDPASWKTLNVSTARQRGLLGRLEDDGAAGDMDAWNGPHDASWDTAQAALARSGVTDGLPVIPPTQERVDAMLRICRVERSQSIAAIAACMRGSHMARCRNQRRDGRLRSSVPARSGCSRGSDLRGGIQLAGHRDDDRLGDRLHHRERTRCARHRHEQRRERIRSGKPRECDHRARGTLPDIAERRRRACW